MIYIHIPFCRSFCTYCDFYSEIAARCSAGKDEESYERYASALVAEAGLMADEITDEVNTLYIGGGTPSVLPLSVYKSLLLGLDGLGFRGPFSEFTVEVNPEDIVEKGGAYVEGLIELGVNRVSMGVQSFDDGILKWMNRRHDADTAVKAYSILEDAGIGNISIDLIFGLPQLSDRQWKDTLSRALSVSRSGSRPQHISSYQLSVEPGSALSQLLSSGKWSEASEEVCRRQYDILCETLNESGYIHYEISNFALPGYEAQHNSAYWRHVPYLGLGPGAHSFLAPDRRQWNNPDIKEYMASFAAGDFNRSRGFEVLTQEQLSIEHIMLGLRTADGLSEEFLRSNTDSGALDMAISSGNLIRIGEKLRIPEDRFFISDNIIAALV